MIILITDIVLIFQTASSQCCIGFSVNKTGKRKGKRHKPKHKDNKTVKKMRVLDYSQHPALCDLWARCRKITVWHEHVFLVILQRFYNAVYHAKNAAGLGDGS